MTYNRENLEWRPITGYEGQYEVSNYGDFHILSYEFIDKANRRIKRKERYIWSEELKEYGGDEKQGKYLGIHLGGMKKTYAHILAAREFCPNPEQKPEVNHKNGNTKHNYCGCKENNYEDTNLEWVTRKENMEHASKNGLINHESNLRKLQCKKNREKVDYDKMKKPVIQINPTTGEFIKEYESVSQASRETGIRGSGIQAVASHKKYRKISGGYGWIYKEEYDASKDNKIVVDQTSGNRKGVVQKTLDGQVVNEYMSISEACRKTGFKGSTYIGECCSGKRKYYKNYIWEFKKD